MRAAVVALWALLAARAGGAQGQPVVTPPRAALAGTTTDLMVVDFTQLALGPLATGGGAGGRPALVIGPGGTLMPASAAVSAGLPSLAPLDGALEVVDHLGQRMLKATSRSTLLLTLPARTVLPPDFTVEVDLVPKSCCQPEDLALEGTAQINQGTASANLLWRHEDIRSVGGGPTFDQPMPPDLAARVQGQFTSVVVTFQGDLITVYTNGRQVYALPNRQFVRGRVIRIFLGGQNATDQAVYLARVRVAAGVAGGPLVAGPAASGGPPRAGQVGGASAAGTIGAAPPTIAPGTGTAPPAPVTALPPAPVTGTTSPTPAPATPLPPAPVTGTATPVPAPLTPLPPAPVTGTATAMPASPTALPSLSFALPAVKAAGIFYSLGTRTITLTPPVAKGIFFALPTTTLTLPAVKAVGKFPPP